MRMVVGYYIITRNTIGMENIKQKGKLEILPRLVFMYIPLKIYTIGLMKVLH